MMLDDDSIKTSNWDSLRIAHCYSQKLQVLRPNLSDICLSWFEMTLGLMKNLLLCVVQTTLY
jgi:hypothetical protein